MAHKKILGVASTGGHFVQLKKILSGLECDEGLVVSYIRTKICRSDKYGDGYLVSDISRTSLIRLPYLLLELIYIIGKERPDVVLTTGALPGLVAVFVSRLFFIKAVWVDSVANSKKISSSGRLAKYVATVSLTQWPHLAKGRYMYVGSVL